MRKPHRPICPIACTLLLLGVFGLKTSEAGGLPVAPPHSSPNAITAPLPGLGPESGAAFERFLATDIPPADGFDFPVGDPDGWGTYTDARDGRERIGWSVYIRFGQRYSYGIHPGEDWNGSGLGNSDEGQPVHAVATGQVVFAGDVEPAGGVIIVQHVFYENHRKRRIRSVYKHLTELRVQTGERVERRQILGLVGRGTKDRYLAHLHFELRWDESLGPTYWPSARKKSLAWIHEHYAPPSAFIRAHRMLYVPQREEHLALIHTAGRRLRIYRRGEFVSEHPIGFGRPSGQRPRAAFDKPQQGMYFVVDVRRALVGGDFGPRTDASRLQLNYPNPYDAARARQVGLVSPIQEARIASAWWRRQPTPAGLLGRGLAFSGRIQAWSPDQPKTSGWGSLLMYPADLRRITTQLPRGSMVIIF